MVADAVYPTPFPRSSLCLALLSLHTFPCHPAFRQVFPAYETLVSPA